MKSHVRRVALAATASLLLALALTAGPAGAAKPKYKVYASCADKKPFKAAHHCGYDRSNFSRTTFVFKSNVGKRAVKVCQKIYGLPISGGKRCAKFPPTAYKVLPYVVSGTNQSFTAVLTWYVKVPGLKKGFKRAVKSSIRVG